MTEGQSGNSKTPAPDERLKCHRQRFTEEEDTQLLLLIPKYGLDDWARIAQFLPGRTPRQIRDRWNNYLCQNPCDHSWTQSEDAQLLQAFSKFGRQWSRIAKLFPGRSSISIRNRMGQLDKVILKKRRKPSQTPKADSREVFPSCHLLPFPPAANLTFPNLVDD